MDECSLPKARPILCNESPAFQRLHMSVFCAAESPNRFPWVINTTFGEKTYIRWCCNDRLSSQHLSGTSCREPPETTEIELFSIRFASDTSQPSTSLGFLSLVGRVTGHLPAFCPP